MSIGSIMPKHTVPIVLMAMVLGCSTLAYPFTESEEFTPTNEGKLHRIEDMTIKDHEGAFEKEEAALNHEKLQHALKKMLSSRVPETAKNEELSNNIYVQRIMAVKATMQLCFSLSGLEKKKLRNQLLDVAVLQHWNSIDDFVRYCLKMKEEAESVRGWKTDLPTN